MSRVAEGQFEELADRHGVFVVYPEGVERSWNDGRGSDRIHAQAHGIDDVGYLRALVAHLVREHPIDPERVFATGISNGGLMSLRLLCEPGSPIRAAAAVTASLGARIADRCEPTPPRSLLLVNGTEDPLVPYDGGDITLFGRSRGAVLSTDATLAHWREAMGCPAEASVDETLPDRDPDDGTRVRQVEWGPCEGGSRVGLVRIDGGGHTWPGGWQYLPELVIGRTSRDVRGADLIWEFFDSVSGGREP